MDAKTRLTNTDTTIGPATIGRVNPKAISLNAKKSDLFLTKPETEGTHSPWRNLLPARRLPGRETRSRGCLKCDNRQPACASREEGSDFLTYIARNPLKSLDSEK
jgi:hypothetical protein